MVRKRIYELIATALIGDGTLFLIDPVEHMVIWIDAVDHPLWKRLFRWYAAHPGVGRLSGLVEIALGVWIIVRAYRDKRD